MNRKRAHNTWPRVRKRLCRVKGKRYLYWTVDLGLVDGHRKFLNFSTREEAELEAEKKRIERNRIGHDALRLSDDQKKDAAKALQILRNMTSLEACASFYVKHHAPGVSVPTVQQLYDEYLERKRAAGRREPTLRDIKHRIGKLAKSQGNTPVNEITSDDLERWLDTEGYQGVTRANFRRLFGGFFNYALKRGMIQANPVHAVEKPSIDEKIPEILRPEEAEKLMASAESESPEMVPYFALALFAGIRPTELRSLHWSDIDLKARRIRVSPEAAKRRRQRYVDISDNLADWLLRFGGQDGPMYFDRQKFEAVRRKAGIKWASDVCRHSFGSYHLAMHENAGLTSLQMGHQNTAILFNHYRDLVTRENARKFWEIRPQREAKVLRFPTAAG